MARRLLSIACGERRGAFRVLTPGAISSPRAERWRHGTSMPEDHCELCGISIVAGARHTILGLPHCLCGACAALSPAERDVLRTRAMTRLLTEGQK